MAEESLVLTEVRGSVLLITINRPRGLQLHQQGDGRGDGARRSTASTPTGNWPSG